jgi:hypothetical protein
VSWDAVRAVRKRAIELVVVVVVVVVGHDNDDWKEMGEGGLF